MTTYPLLNTFDYYLATNPWLKGFYKTTSAYYPTTLWFLHHYPAQANAMLNTLIPQFLGPNWKDLYLFLPFGGALPTTYEKQLDPGEMGWDLSQDISKYIQAHHITGYPTPN